MVDAFDRLGLEPRFDLAQGAIERAFLRRIAAVHPDASGEDGGEAAELADARRVLDDPERRAEALLSRLGGPGKEDRSLPEGFLVEIMSVREDIETDPDRRKWSAWAEQRRAHHIERVARLFSGLMDGDDPDRRRAIRVELNAWRYAERLIEQLDPEYDPARADFT